MKKLAFLLSLSFLMLLSAAAQPKIHSHNDYAQTKPLLSALQNQIDIIEADVFLVNGKLYVAHTLKEIDTAKSLQKMYIDPLIAWLKRTKNPYRVQLMIDVKGDWKETYDVLQTALAKKDLKFFDSTNGAVQIVFSGNRPPSGTFHNYPKWVNFDGLPQVAYAPEDLAKVTMISDNFKNYTNWNGRGSLDLTDHQKLSKVIAAAQNLRKPIRFWNAPDQQQAWETLGKLGAGIINTDQIEACKAYFHHKNEFKR